jgi:hypothetical protein
MSPGCQDMTVVCKPLPKSAMFAWLYSWLLNDEALWIFQRRFIIFITIEEKSRTFFLDGEKPSAFSTVR